MPELARHGQRADERAARSRDHLVPGVAQRGDRLADLVRDELVEGHERAVDVEGDEARAVGRTPGDLGGRPAP